MKLWKRYRFNTYAVDDYRPLIFNPKYPWWCSGYGSNYVDPVGDIDEDSEEWEQEEKPYAVIVAYLPADEDLLKYWDDAFDVDFTEEDEITFSDRFAKPDYFEELK